MSKKDKLPWYKRLYMSVEGSMEESFGDFAPLFTAMFFIIGTNRALYYSFYYSFNGMGYGISI